MNKNIEKTGLTSKILWQLHHKIKEFPEIEKVKIFGSRAMGNYKKTSDIDLAIFGEKINFDTVSKFHGELEEEISTALFFDVIDFKSLDNKELQEHINTYGILL